MMRRAFLMSLFLAALGLCVILVLLGRTLYDRFNPPAPAPSAASVLDIGGAFTLIDTHGKIRQATDFRGQYMLIYFGFTFCPDICPLSLTIISDALDMMDDSQNAIVPVFITIDPARDTPSAIATYLEHFHPRFVGLSGSEAQIAEAARTWRVYYQKTPLAESGEQNDEGGDYTMDHSSIFYLMGRDGGFVTHFDHNVTAETMSARLQVILARARAKN